jgi:hypothetical protein
MTSPHRGRSWEERRVPEPLIDVVADRSGRAMIAATESRLRPLDGSVQHSADGGRSWRLLTRLT